MPRIGLALIFAISLLFGGSSPVFASCDPHRTNYGDTVWSLIGHVSHVPYEIHAAIEQYKPYVQYNGDGTPNQVYAWVMMAEGSSRWVQFGWRQQLNGNGTSGGRWDWIQYWTDRNYYDNYSGGNAASAGVNTNYAIEADDRNPCCLPGRHWIFRLNSNQIWDSYASDAVDQFGTWEPDTYEVAGEINSYGSQIPGETGNHVLFDNVQEAGSDFVYHNINTDPFPSWQGPVNIDDSIAMGDKVDGNTYKIWDGDC